MNAPLRNLRNDAEQQMLRQLGAVSTVAYVADHNDRLIQQAYDVAEDLRLAHNERTPEAVEQELSAALLRRLVSMDLRGLVSVHAEPQSGVPKEFQEDALTVVLERVDDKRVIGLFAALLASDAAAPFRQAVASIYAQDNADGIAAARGFREDDEDVSAWGVGA